MQAREGLLSQFVEHALEHGAGNVAGSCAQTNEAYDAMAAVVREIRGTSGDSMPLANLLDHDSVDVRSWAAMHLLAEAPERALPVLRSISSEPGLVGFAAEMAVSQWEDGTFRPPR